MYMTAKMYIGCIVWVWVGWGFKNLLMAISWDFFGKIQSWDLGLYWGVPRVWGLTEYRGVFVLLWYHMIITYMHT